MCYRHILDPTQLMDAKRGGFCSLDEGMMVYLSMIKLEVWPIIYTTVCCAVFVVFVVIILVFLSNSMWVICWHIDYTTIVSVNKRGMANPSVIWDCVVSFRSRWLRARYHNFDTALLVKNSRAALYVNGHVMYSIKSRDGYIEIYYFIYYFVDQGVVQLL